MRVKDLIDKQGLFNDPLIKSNLIAQDGKDGKVLFDTRRNKQEVIDRYREGEIIALWADFARSDAVGGYGATAYPIIRIYVHHDSWKEEET